MASSGNTWCKKLMAKRKKNWLARNMGTCTPHSVRGFNAGRQIGLVEKVVEPGKIVSTAPHAKYTKRSFNKWAKYA